MAKKPDDKEIAALAAKRYDEENNPYAWSSRTIEELRKRGFTPAQQKNIIWHLMAESDGIATRVQGDYHKDYKGDNGSFKIGRGLVQLTNYDSYLNMEKMTGIPLTKHPELAAHPEHAPVIAAAYYKWKQNMFKNLNYDNLEHVHRATGPAETFAQRTARMAKSQYRVPDDSDLYLNTPAYDASNFKVNENETLTEDISTKIIKMSNVGKGGITPDTTPTSR